MDRRIYTNTEKSTQETESEVGIGTETGIQTQRHEHRNRNIHRHRHTQAITDAEADAHTRRGNHRRYHERTKHLKKANALALESKCSKKKVINSCSLPLSTHTNIRRDSILRKRCG